MDAKDGLRRASGRAGRAGRTIRIGALAAAIATGLALGVVTVAGEGSGGWKEWGGRDQAFRAPASGLAESWPEEGPKTLWERELGEGYSAVLVEGNRLYTMHRVGEQEAVVALDAKNGETVWETKYDASPAEGHVDQFGRGPRSTPLLSGDRLVTIGVSGVLHCLKKTDGSVLWSHDLWAEPFNGSFLNHGYSSSAIEVDGNFVVLVGGEDASIVALDRKDGEVVWKTGGFANSYSTPRVLTIDGKRQIVAFMATELVGIDPKGGDILWTFAHQNQWRQNINMPAVTSGNHLFLSSPEAGSKGLKLTRDGDGMKVEEVWSTRKIQFYHSTSVQDGDWVYGSTGTMSPAFLTAINIKTGEIAWRERGFAKSNVLGVGERLLVLDEDGQLALVSASPEGLTVHAKAQVLDQVAWTVPTVVGSTAYVRDKGRLVALDLS